MPTHPGHMKGHPPYPGCEKGGINGGRPRELSDEKLDAIAEHFCEWAEDEKNIVLREFACEYRKGQQWLSEMAKRNKRFADALAYAKTKIGARRERLAGKEIDSGVVKTTMANYDLEHRKWLLELKNASSEAEAQKAVTYLVRGQMMREEREARDKKSNKEAAVQS